MPRKSWTTKEIGEGFNRFFEESGRLPTALEIDRLDYLPSSRYIQLSYGGLEKLRRQLGYSDTHFGKGQFRSAIANRVNHQGRAAEKSLEKVLREHFGEVFVHTEKIFGRTKNRVDFYVYTPDGDFGVDIFSTQNAHTFKSNINIKLKKYEEFSKELFLVVENSGFRQNEIEQYIAARKTPLPPHVQVVTLAHFKALLKEKRFYPNPLSK